MTRGERESGVSVAGDGTSNSVKWKDGQVHIGIGNDYKVLDVLIWIPSAASLKEDVVDEDALHDGGGLLLGLERFVVLLQRRLQIRSINYRVSQ